MSVVVMGLITHTYRIKNKNQFIIPQLNVSFINYFVVIMITIEYCFFT